MAMDAKAAAAKDTTSAREVTVHTRRRGGRDDGRGGGSGHTGPTANSYHSLRRKAQARVSLCQAGEAQRGDSSLGRQRAGKRDRGQNHLLIAAARSRW